MAKRRSATHARLMAVLPIVARSRLFNELFPLFPAPVISLLNLRSSSCTALASAARNGLYATWLAPVYVKVIKEYGIEVPPVDDDGVT